MRLDNIPINITGITADSRRVQPGYLFAALPGTHSDGRSYINDAVAKGAVAVLAVADTSVPAPAVLVTSINVRADFATYAAQFYGTQPQVLFAVTGTNGKTSTVNFLQQFWELLGDKSAAIGTLGVYGTAYEKPGSLTTPDAASLHATLADLARHDIQHVAVEASSHGLEQYRLSGAKISTAIFTNITRDHLDYHGTMEAYFQAKVKLFSEVLQPDGAAVLNADNAYFPKLRDICLKRGVAVLSYGEQGEAVRLVACQPTPAGFNVTLSINSRAYETILPLIGRFQVWNIMAAIGALLTDQRQPQDIINCLPKLRSVKGRLQHVGTTPNGAPIFVDYAHTPDALETVLKNLREHVTGKLIVVFGCGGNRDKGKRPIMGRLAAQLANAVIVTDDNPRHEDAATIRRAVMAGCPDAREIGDRHQAIQTAVQNLQAGDVLIIAGKGHESGQIVGDAVLPFDDAEEVVKALNINMAGAA